MGTRRRLYCYLWATAVTEWLLRHIGDPAHSATDLDRPRQTSTDLDNDDVDRAAFLSWSGLAAPQTDATMYPSDASRGILIPVKISLPDKKKSRQG